jgi:hypothetical protein
MSGMTHANFLANRFGRLMKWPWLCGLLCLLLARAALATIPLYENDAVLNYVIPGSPPPIIDATNFVNDNTFTYVNNSNPGLLYEPWNVLNYTNIGYMSANSGFQFDTLTTNVIPHQMANSFYNSANPNSTIPNSGEIDCYFQLIVWATNIVNPGTIVMGPSTRMQLTGGSVDLSQSTVTMEGFGSIFSGTLGVSPISAAVGTDTNSDWTPATDLTPTNALSSRPVASQLSLPDSTPYFNIQGVGTSNVIISAIFLYDQSPPNVTHNIYFNTNTSMIGGGFDTIEWIGAYVDSVSGGSHTNYLYLNDRTDLSTNNYINTNNNITAAATGVPNNLFLTNSLARILIGATNQPGFPPGFSFNPGVVTNFYSYLNAQLISATEATNASLQNPSGAFSNLTDQIFITANRELDLTLAQITGPNYLSLMATNQFDGSAGAVIVAPYSDISLGATNGFLTISNLLQAALPNWSGTIQAWSGRWFFVDPISGITNDFRVLLVHSQVAPTTLSQVQHFYLHATNSVFISDAFNILDSLYIDAQNLTLTTNGYGNGATSPEGALNLQSATIVWQSALPNVRNLTNNGAITTENLIVFGGPPPANYTNFINNGLISDLGSQIYANNFVNSGLFSCGTGSGSFQLQSLTTVLTNGSITAGGDVSITAGSLLASNLVLQAGRSLTLQVTNLLTDIDTADGNSWSVGGGSLVGLNLPNNPTNGDLRGTTIYCTAPLPNKQVVNTWAGLDQGASVTGYTNNVAVGVLILDALGTNSTFQFTGTGTTSNAIYVDELMLLDSATNFDVSHVNALNISTNMVIYYAQAMVNGFSVAEKLNHLNNNRLRWVTNYAGRFSSTIIVFPDGTTYPFNAALAQSPDIDSDGDGIDNLYDPTPFGNINPTNLPPPPVVQINLTITTTNKPVLTSLLTWQTIADATNYAVFYKTNFTMTNWLSLTNIFTPALATSPPVTVIIFDPVTNSMRAYRVRADMQ